MALRFRNTNYNIFEKEDGKFEGLIFDHYMRVKVKTFPRDTREEAVKDSHSIIKNLLKGFTNPGGIWVDEGKEIREKETAEAKERAKEMRMQRKVY